MVGLSLHRRNGCIVQPTELYHPRIVGIHGQNREATVTLRAGERHYLHGAFPACSIFDGNPSLVCVAPSSWETISYSCIGTSAPPPLPPETSLDDAIDSSIADLQTETPSESVPEPSSAGLLTETALASPAEQGDEGWPSDPSTEASGGESALEISTPPSSPPIENVTDSSETSFNPRPGEVLPIHGATTKDCY